MSSLKSNPSSSILVGLLLFLFFISQNEMRTPFRYHSNQLEESNGVHHGTTSSSSRQNLGVHFAASHEEFEELLRDAGIEDTYKNSISSLKSDDLISLAPEVETDHHAEGRTTKNSIDEPLSTDPGMSSTEKNLRSGEFTSTKIIHQGGRIATFASANSILFVSVIASGIAVCARRLKIIQKLHI